MHHRQVTDFYKQRYIYYSLRLPTPPMETPDPPSDTPGASKQVVLTPHDIPRSLRVIYYVLTRCDPILCFLLVFSQAEPEHTWLDSMEPEPSEPSFSSLLPAPKVRSEIVSV